VVPAEDAAIVLEWREETSNEGIKIRLVTGSWSFGNYESAVAYIENKDGGNYVVGSPDPFKTPVPLDELTDYELVYGSSQKSNNQSLVKIFEYTAAATAE
jgi:hypothetical protein